MSKQSAAGKLAAQRRAVTFAPDLRERIERDAAARYARWQAGRGEPRWLRIKRALRSVWIAIVEN
jgi:hypothetical protein